MWNLEAYNNGWGLLWWKEWFSDYLESEISAFEEIIKIERKKPVNKNLSVKDFNSKIWIIRETERIQIDINSIYSNLKNVALQKDISTETLINRMLKMHLSLSEGINILNKSCEISVKVCNSQKTWLWYCGQCY
jgi:hypothetical protein